ncbi:MAG: hypothetical protein J6P87_03440, partial [Lachnospiraceae bacterium]|nr:hypothetical protein [Lachnospiraceae bacterium]
EEHDVGALLHDLFQFLRFLKLIFIHRRTLPDYNIAFCASVGNTGTPIALLLFHSVTALVSFTDNCRTLQTGPAH